MKRLLSIILAVSMVFALGVSAAAENELSVTQVASAMFADVGENYSWASDHIDFLAEQGVVEGVSEGVYDPDSFVTREQFAKMLVLAFNKELSTSTVGSFSDVSPAKWSYQYIETAKSYINYSSLVDGTKKFRPEEYATREEIANAVVAVLGLTEADSLDVNYGHTKFSDFSSISAAFAVNVSLAAEYGIVEGVTNTEFDPKSNVTRAACAVMISRAAKLTQSSVYNTMGLRVSIAEGDTRDERVMSISAPNYTIIKVDGEEIKMTETAADRSVGTYTFSFVGEQRLQFKISCEGTSGSCSFTVSYTRLVSAPSLSVDASPEETGESTYTFKGVAADAYDYSVKIYMNGEYIDYLSFEKTVTLQPGENTFSFYAENNLGKRSEVITRTIVYNDDVPYIKFDPEIPETVDDGTLTIAGSVVDSTDNLAAVYLNGELIGTGTFRKIVNLNLGENSFTIAAVNKNGVRTEKTFTVSFEYEQPVITLRDYSTETTRSSYTVAGSVSDLGATVYINGVSCGTSPFSASFELEVGENEFEVYALSDNGAKSEVTTFTVLFTPSAPSVSVDANNVSVRTNAYTLSGRVGDANDTAPRIYINGEYYGTGTRFSKEVSLVDGGNGFRIVAINKYGLESEPCVVKVTFDSKAIDLYVNSYPTISYEKTVDISGYMLDFDSGTTLYINDQTVSYNTRGRYEKTISLETGTNTVVVRAVNSYGKETVKTLTITYQPA